MILQGIRKKEPDGCHFIRPALFFLTRECNYSFLLILFVRMPISLDA